MRVDGVSEIASELENVGYFVKAIVNREGAVLFSSLIQHRDMKRNGLSYEDDYEGNALAAVIKPSKIEVRFHSAFQDDAVRDIFTELLASAEMKWASGFTVEYQGRVLLPRY